MRKLASTFVRKGTVRFINVKDSDKKYAIRVEKEGNISLFEYDAYTHGDKWVTIHNSSFTSRHLPLKAYDENGKEVKNASK